MRFVIVALVIVLACQAQAQEGQTDTRGQARAEQDRPADPLGPIRIEIIESKAEADARKRREEEASRNEIDDLRAQQGMNEATQRMATYSWWQTLFVGAGTFLLLGTLFLTIGANKAATAAVEAAKANALLQADQRPWLAFVLRRVSIEEAEGSGQVAKATVTLKNYGKSPAMGIRVSCRLDFPKLVLDNSDRSEKYAAEVIADKWRWGNTVLFPAIGTDLSGYSEPIDDAPEGVFSPLLLVCITYRAKGTDSVMHAAKAFRIWDVELNSALADNGGVDMGSVTYVNGSDSVG